MLKITLTIIFVGFIQPALLAPTIDLQLITSLRQKPHTNILISMNERPTSVLNRLKTKHFQSREDRLNVFAQTLKAFCSKSQKHVLQYLNEQQQIKPIRNSILWITNQIAVRGADLELVQQLAELSDISKIEEEFFIELDAPLDLQVMDNLDKSDDEEFQWGVKQIEAPRVWSSGNNGEGIIVGTVDSGARYTHEALRDGFVGDYGWLDPRESTLTPSDLTGHGTHTTANIAGRARHVGVAPGVKWAACKGCVTFFCSEIDLLECGHFMACPTLANGSNPDCSRAPHVVSNSWGGGQGNMWYYDVIKYYHIVGIIPLFSAGNSGPSCGSANSPGDYDNLIDVGSTTIDNKLSNFSSVGPTVDKRMKPDIAAPGSNVFSAYHTSDTAYATMSGTSMACPHAAGVVALLLAENPSLTFEQVKEILEGGSEATIPTGANCGGISEEQYPNFHVGHGRINAFNSIRTARAQFKNSSYLIESQNK